MRDFDNIQDERGEQAIKYAPDEVITGMRRKVSVKR